MRSILVVLLALSFPLALSATAAPGPTINVGGVRPLQYYPHDAYLAWMDATSVPAVEAQPSVRWRGLVHPAYKVSPELAAWSGTVP